jgi:hypothetical protein
MKPQSTTKRDHWETDYGPWAKKAEWSSRGLSSVALRPLQSRLSSLWRLVILATGLVAVVSTTFIIAD